MKKEITKVNEEKLYELFGTAWDLVNDLKDSGTDVDFYTEKIISLEKSILA